MRQSLTVVLFVLGLGLLGNAQEDYFQQFVAYDIQVELDDQRHTIKGSETITYVNNSPNELRFIYFHLWPNAYSHRRHTHLAQQLLHQKSLELLHANDEDLGYIDSLDFKVGGKDVEWFLLTDTVDVCKVMLPKALLPGDSIEIFTPFRVKFPAANISRIGHTDQSYQATQWYPKPAVYDQNGWHQMPYLNLGEFYSEFGTFDVRITAPDNYIIAATGDLQNKKEVDWLNAKAKETKAWLKKFRESEDFNTLNENTDHPNSSRVKKTLHFHQENVHDFAWFADKRFRVLKGEVELPHSKEKVEVWTYFTEPNAEDWSKSIEYMHDAIYYYSLWNGDYPYAHASAVDGVISAGGGMEYPNVTVIGEASGELELETVIMHEVGHNWFYGILGSNERDYPWMDEGMNTYNEQRYLDTKYPNGVMLDKDGTSVLSKLAGLRDYELKDVHYFTYFLSGRRNLDQPINTASEDFSMLNYGAIVYSKTGALFNYLRHYLGDELMDKCMQAYFEAYKFKHPYPDDVKRVFEETSEQDLGWFFDHLLKDRRKIDFKITGTMKIEPGKMEVTIKNESGIPLPFCVGAFNAGETNPVQWYGPIEDDTTVVVEHWRGQQVAIDPNLVIPETRRDDNFAKSKGVLKRIEPIKPEFVFKIEKPWKNQVNWLPTLNYNYPSGFMVGVALYNSLLPVKRFNYVVAPMYSFTDKDVYGAFDMWYGITPRQSVFQNIDIGIGGRRFDSGLGSRFTSSEEEDFAFVRLRPYVNIGFRPADFNSYFKHSISINTVLIDEQSFGVDDGELTKVNNQYSFFRTDYTVIYGHPVTPASLELSGEFSEGFSRSSVTLSGQFLPKRHVNFNWRLFGGAFIQPIANNLSTSRYSWQLDGQGAATDYAYDGQFLDRSIGSDFLSRQFMQTHGAFRSYTPGFISDSWLVSAYFDAKPWKSPIGVFVDLGYGDFSGRYVGVDFIASAGLYTSLGGDFLMVYLPLIFTPNLRDALDDNGFKTVDMIRFSINLNRVNVFSLVRDLDII